MVQRSTDRARRVMLLAHEEASRLGHGRIETEHLLLGLIREGDGVAARTLESLGVGLEGVRRRVEEIAGRGPGESSEYIPYAPGTRKVLDRSGDESLRLGHDYVGTEHLLLGLLGEPDGLAARILAEAGADAGTIRQQVTRQLAGTA
jgi:ATP-dependent Clp protease ATP-binding subunit ClpC